MREGGREEGGEGGEMGGGCGWQVVCSQKVSSAFHRMSVQT